MASRSSVSFRLINRPFQERTSALGSTQEVSLYSVQFGRLQFGNKMADICRRLIRKNWRSYATDLDEVPDFPGIYVIGDAAGKVLYLGHSKQMQTRLKGHKYGQQYIDKFVNEQFKLNGGIHLQIKWVEEAGHGCVESSYLQCMKNVLGYWPRFNMQQGNTC
ncbi:uncharacterized protein [Montipora capricornis]|uniref:uncharacterized protein n=1 Tax=Montipora capricornis TaxID=246305 RepID=UPI0035F151AE